MEGGENGPKWGRNETGKPVKGWLTDVQTNGDLMKEGSGTEGFESWKGCGVWLLGR